MAELAGSLWRRWGSRRALVGSALVVALVAVGDWALRRARAAWGGATPGAQWIWAQPAGEPYRATVFFAVRDFEVRSLSPRASLRVQADEEHLVLLNGQPVGSGRYRDGEPMAVWEVAPLLRLGANRLAVELRSGRGVGGLLVMLEGLSGGPIVSGPQWRIVRSYEKALSEPGAPFSGEPPRVWAVAPTGRWGAPEVGAERPLLGRALASPEGVFPVRARKLDSSQWLPTGAVDWRSPAISDRVIFDWGRVVVGYPSLIFAEGGEAKALLWAGRGPPGSAGPVTRYALKAGGRRAWTDSEPLTLRYLIVHSTRPLAGARMFELDEAARQLVREPAAAGGAFGLEPAPLTPAVENEIRRELEGLAGVPGR